MPLYCLLLLQLPLFSYKAYLQCCELEVVIVAVRCKEIVVLMRCVMRCV
jgi:hypothetical protein